MSPTPAIIAAAADWAAELDAGDVGPARRQACEDWCRQDPRHRVALDRMRALDARMARLDGAGRFALRDVLARGKPRGRAVGPTILALALVIGAGLFAAQSFGVREHFAGHETAVGEVRGVDLADGSHLDLDTNAALDVDLSGDRRKVTLYRGQILAHVAPTPGVPFVVETRHATAEALGTAYVVRDEGRSTLVTVVESTVRLCARRTTDACLILRPGERGRVADGRVERLAAVDPGAAAGWAGGWLEVDDRPIADVLTELNRYRTEPILFDAEALARVRITGAYPLSNTDLALESLAQTAELRVRRQADGSVRITP